LMAAPVVLPILAAAARPLIKAAVKGGYMMYEKGREAVEEIAEVLEDLAEEVKAEAQAELTEKE
jgi:hypothetical protein